MAVVDREVARLEHVRSRYPQIPHFVRDTRDLYDMDLDAVVIATPPETHFALAKDFLERGIDVMVEKPLTSDADRGVDLVELAAARDRILMVGHVFVHNPAVTALREMVRSGELGHIRYVDSVRAGLGLFHPSLNVIWDLAPHDISILLYVLGQTPETVDARGIACVQRDIADVAYLSMMFGDGVMAHVRLSWLDPCKTRRMTIVGSRKMVVYDDLEVHEKLKVYDKSVNAIRQTDTFGEYQFSYHYGSVVSPYIQFEEPLRLECQHFVESVQTRTTPLTDGANGVEVVRVIEAAQRSLANGGATERVHARPEPEQVALPNILWLPEAEGAPVEASAEAK
jgi:predicted dehydrogenase